MDNTREVKERCKFKVKRKMLSLMVRHVHTGYERSEIAEKLTKHEGYGFFPAMSKANRSRNACSFSTFSFKEAGLWFSFNENYKF